MEQIIFRSNNGSEDKTLDMEIIKLKKKQKKNGNHFFPASLDTYGKYKG